VSEGQVSDLRILFERHHPKLFAFFVRMTGNREMSEDLTQDVFVRILKYRQTFRPGGSFRTWIYQIARNARMSEGARQHPEHPVDPARLESIGPS